MSNYESVGERYREIEKERQLEEMITRMDKDAALSKAKRQLTEKETNMNMSVGKTPVIDKGLSDLMLENNAMKDLLRRVVINDRMTPGDMYDNGIYWDAMAILGLNDDDVIKIMEALWVNKNENQN